MTGDEPIHGHVFKTEPYRRLLVRRWRWRCSCGATEGGHLTRTSATYAGDNHTLGR
ncbi:hypothetical protein J2S40_004503 [Nocardioides luteus]|nr:hypothetical protein [Nocardioides luteus]